MRARLRSSLPVPSVLLLSVLSLSSLGCPKADDPKPSPSDDSTKDDSKKKKKSQADDDDDSSSKTKKKKPKQADDDDDKTKPKDDGSEALDDQGHNVNPAVIPPTTPVPSACAPDPAGKLGPKPKLLASAGEPGASMAVWGKAGETPLSNLAITIHADGRCYVDYLAFTVEPGVDPTAQFMGFEVPKGAVSGMTGVAERGASSFVGFRVVYDSPMRSGQELHVDTKARFYGYVAANGVPYSCAAIPGEKGCAMYQKPLVAHVGEKCALEKGGGPADVLLGQLQPKIKIGGGAPPATSLTIVAPPIVAPDAGALIVVDAGSADGGTCNGATCATNAFMLKETDHIYVRLAAGKPKACTPSSGPRAGETYYFDEGAWKKR